MDCCAQPYPWTTSISGHPRRSTPVWQYGYCSIIAYTAVPRAIIDFSYHFATVIAAELRAMREVTLSHLLAAYTGKCTMPVLDVVGAQMNPNGVDLPARGRNRLCSFSPAALAGRIHITAQGRMSRWGNGLALGHAGVQVLHGTG